MVGGSASRVYGSTLTLGQGDLQQPVERQGNLLRVQRREQICAGPDVNGGISIGVLNIDGGEVHHGPVGRREVGTYSSANLEPLMSGK